MRRLLLLFVACSAGCVSGIDSDPAGTNAATVAGSDSSETQDANQAIASGVTGSDVWLGRLNRGRQWSITDLYNVTTRQGYDNQPAFTVGGGGVYYSSIRDGTQSDVYLFEDSVRAGFRFTSTPQSEFSPRPLPAGKGISVVRVEADGQQALWRYAGNQPLRMLPGVDNLGYYTWLDTETVAMFLVTEPPTLALGSITDGEIKKIAAQPGRTLVVIPGTDTLSFVDKSDEDAWWISRYDRGTDTLGRIAPALEGSEDFAWTPDGDLLMSQGRKIYIWREQWVVAVDLEGSIPGDISRLTVDPRGKYIAFVAAEGG